jgi:hypothetical protein
MHVYSGCNPSNWVDYKYQLELPPAVMDDTITNAYIGYSDDADLKQPTFDLVSGWVRTLTHQIENKNVGGAVLMRPENDRVAFVTKANLNAKEYEQAAPLLQAAPFIANWGQLSDLGKPEESANE